MDAHEQQLVVSADARPSRQLAGRAWLRAGAQARMPHPWSIRERCAARAAEPIGKLSDCQLLATAIARVDPNGATRAAPIQYP